MAIDTFKPLTGPRAGIKITFPIISRPDTSANPDIDSGGQSLVPTAESSGVYDASGLGAFPVGAGQLNLVWTVFEGWLVKQGFSGDSKGLERYQQIIDRSIYRGGTGYLVDTPPNNTRDIDTNVPISWYKAAVKIYAQPKFEPLGIAMARFTATFVCPTGYWVDSNGNQRSFGILSP